MNPYKLRFSIFIMLVYYSENFDFVNECICKCILKCNFKVYSISSNFIDVLRHHSIVIRFDIDKYHIQLKSPCFELYQVITKNSIDIWIFPFSSDHDERKKRKRRKKLADNSHWISMEFSHSIYSTCLVLDIYVLH